MEREGRAVGTQQSVLSPVSATARREWREWMPWTEEVPGTGEAAGGDIIGNQHEVQVCTARSSCRHGPVGRAPRQTGGLPSTRPHKAHRWTKPSHTPSLQQCFSV